MSILVVLTFCLVWLCLTKNNNVEGFACNWGRVSSQPLPGDVAVKLMKDNGFDKVKLFDADPEALKALANSSIKVMVGIPNVYLESLVENNKFSDDWVAQNVSAYINDGVDIRYVAVSNEAFLLDFKDRFIHKVLPALKAVKSSLDKAGLGKKVQVTLPINADVYESPNGLPSGADFRANVTDEIVDILKFLNETNAPLAINIYPCLSLYYDSHFPKEYAFFNSTTDSLVDGDITYTNAFDGNLDTLISALQKHDLGSLPIIVGEVGWPTNGAVDANIANAQRFYQGLVDRINSKRGPPKRPNEIPEVYMFGLLDEDSKSILPGNFEPHWGIFNYDGSIKYQLDLGDGKKLVPSEGVKYMKKQWCVLDPKANIDDPKMKENWKIACGASTGCTNVGNGSACEYLDNRTKASFAFNSFYQVRNQNKDGCVFNGFALITDKDPSPSNDSSCKFGIALDVEKVDISSPAPSPTPITATSRVSEQPDGSNNKSLAMPKNQPSSIVIMGIMLLGFIIIIF